MNSPKLNIKLIGLDGINDQVYISYAIQGGFATRDYSLDRGVPFRCNLAFFNVLFNYFQCLPENVARRFAVLQSASIISSVTDSLNAADEIKTIAEMLFGHTYTEEAFHQAKEKTKNGFSQRYKDARFRARLKACEVSELNKRFSLPALIRDIEEIDYQTFCSCAEKLLVVENVCVCAAGDLDTLDENALFQLKPPLHAQNHTVSLAGAGIDPYLRQDAHVLNLARTPVNIEVEAFSFGNTKTTGFTRCLVTELFSQALKGRDVEVSIDALDASILLETPEPISLRSCLHIENEDQFEEKKRSLLVKYYLLMENAPDEFSMLASQRMLIGVSVEQFISFLEFCNYELFYEICQKSDCIMTEAQVVLVKGEKQL